MMARYFPGEMSKERKADTRMRFVGGRAGATGSRMLAASGQIALGCGGAYSSSFSRMRAADLGGAAYSWRPNAPVSHDHSQSLVSVPRFPSLSIPPSLYLSPQLSLSTLAGSLDPFQPASLSNEGIQHEGRSLIIQKAHRLLKCGDGSWSARRNNGRLRQ